MGGLIGIVTSDKNGLARSLMYNLMPRSIMAPKGNTYVKICTVEEIAVGTILYSQGNQIGGMYFCGLIHINAVKKEQIFNVKINKLSGSIPEGNIHLFYRINNNKYDLAISNTDPYIFHNAISNSQNVRLIQEIIDSIEGWTEL